MKWMLTSYFLLTSEVTTTSFTLLFCQLDTLGPSSTTQLQKQVGWRCAIMATAIEARKTKKKSKRKF